MRRDFKIILNIIEQSSKVLDLGCADGELLSILIKEKNIIAKGIEIDPKKVSKSIARGISTHEGDMFEILPHYRDHSYNYVILSQTLHEIYDPKFILEEALRIGRFVIVSFPNFGYIGIRLKILLKGTISNDKLFKYIWESTKNFHPLNIAEFERFCNDNKISINRRYFLYNPLLPNKNKNLFAKAGVFVLEKL